jgi:hypothetical protein
VRKDMQFEDRLSKFLFRSLLEDYTTVEIGSDLLPDTFYADVLIIPDEPLLETIPGLGLFARLTGTNRCLIEAYSRRCSAADLRTSLAKIRLALQRADKDGMGRKPPQGVLWLTVPYWPKKALAEVLHTPYEELEKGLRCWRGHEIIYVVNTSKIQLREDTILFRLLGKGSARRECVLEIFKSRLEPYMTLLNNFDLRFKKMAITEKIHQIDPRLLEDLIDLRDTREETLRELGRQEGQQKGLLKAIKALAKKRFPKINESSFAPLSERQPDELQEILLSLLDVSNIQALRTLFEGKDRIPKQKKR